MTILAVFNIWMVFINYFLEGHFIFNQDGEWIIFYEKGTSFLVGRHLMRESALMNEGSWSGVYHKNNYPNEKVH